jgi:hypothetical protein
MTHLTHNSEPLRHVRHDGSYPMCRALTAALVGRSLEFNTTSFEELLVHYAHDDRSDV